MRISLLTLAVSCATLFGPSAPSAPVTTQPIVKVVRHGGLCATGRECRSVLLITDTRIFGQGYVPRRLPAASRTALLGAIATLKIGRLRAHPFRGTCPTASDGAESLYRFRDFPYALSSCVYDLRGARAVRLTERLLSTLTR